MSKPSKSQWDFGELFPTEATRRVLSVADLTQQVRGLLEKNWGEVWVTGEISNLRAQSSGHIYFTLKDAAAQLGCVLFRGEPVVDRDLIQDGQKLIVRGGLTVYEARGQYQLRVTGVELRGVGALQLAFERLKRKLQAEGWFAPERKRPLPVYPQRIGLVTSPTGAAIRDVLHAIRRRHPALEIILAPCRVQGAGAAEEIAAAIRLLNGFHSAIRPPRPALDLILVTRGGGSLEDLWAFNEEVVARAIFESALPVVSAIGHEIDFTISDFVADLRAATPSAAAELITEGVFASRQFVAETPGRLAQILRLRLEHERDYFGQLAQRVARLHPRRWLNDQLQRLDDLQSNLLRDGCRWLLERRTQARLLQQRLLRVRPARLLTQRRETAAQCVVRLQERTRLNLLNRRKALAHSETRLRLLSPLDVLDRGYSITSDAATGRVIRTAESVRPGQPLRTRLQSGEIRSVVAS